MMSWEGASKGRLLALLLPLLWLGFVCCRLLFVTDCSPRRCLPSALLEAMFLKAATIVIDWCLCLGKDEGTFLLLSSLKNKHTLKK